MKNNGCRMLLGLFDHRGISWGSISVMLYNADQHTSNLTCSHLRQM